MTSFYFIGKNHDKCLIHIHDATGKKKLTPDRSGNVMVSPENNYVMPIVYLTQASSFSCLDGLDIDKTTKPIKNHSHIDNYNGKK